MGSAGANQSVDSYRRVFISNASPAYSSWEVSEQMHLTVIVFEPSYDHRFMTCCRSPYSKLILKKKKKRTHKIVVRMEVLGFNTYMFYVEGNQVEYASFWLIILSMKGGVGLEDVNSIYQNLPPERIWAYVRCTRLLQLEEGGQHWSHALLWKVEIALAIHGDLKLHKLLLQLKHPSKNIIDRLDTSRNGQLRKYQAA